VKLKLSQKIPLIQDGIVKFGDEKVFKCHINTLKGLLNLVPAGKCKVCGDKQFKYIAYPCTHFYACEDCYQREKYCLICKK
jgi:hypothetical protein